MIYKHKIDLSKFPYSKAKKVMSRFKAFIKRNNLHAQLHFILPYVEIKNTSTYKVLSTHCPYCASTLKETENGVVCSGDKLKEIWLQIRDLKAQWGDKVELFLDIRQNRFYDEYMRFGKLTCSYAVGNEERRWRKGPLY